MSAKKLFVLSSRPEFYSTRRLVEAGKDLGLIVQVIDPLNCLLSIEEGRLKLFTDNEELAAPDLFIARIGGPVPDYSLALVAQLEILGATGFNTALSFEFARNKWGSLVRLAALGLPVPRSYFAFRSELSARKILPQNSVVKLLRGSQGRGVMLARGHDSLISLLQGMEEVRAKALVQEFIEESQGRDLRFLVLCGKVVATMERIAPEGEFRSNLHRGGQAIAVVTTCEENELAIRAAQALELDFAGVDIIRSQRGPLVLEVNPSPGIEGIERANKQDLAREIVHALIQKRSEKWMEKWSEK